VRVRLISEACNLHGHLSSLASYKLFALQSRQILRDSRPRGSYQVGDIFVEKRYAQQHAERFFDPKSEPSSSSAIAIRHWLG
jgi:hypothetical protein